MPLNYNPMENAYKTDPTQTHRGTCITFFGTWMDLCAAMIEAAHHLHERLGVEEGDPEACNRLLSAVTNPPADLAEQSGPQWDAQTFQAGEPEPIVDELNEWNAAYLDGEHDEWRETYKSQLP